MEDKVFPDDLLNLILESTLRRHGVEVDKVKLDPANIEALKTTSMELLGRVDEFLKRSKVEETVESVQVEEVEEVEETIQEETTQQPTQEDIRRAIRRSFWGHL